MDEVRKEDNIPMGTAILEVGSILGRKGNAKAKKLKNGGVVYAKLVDAEEYCGTFSFQLSGVDLANTEGMFRKSDPFVQFKRREYGNSGSEWNVVYKSSTVKDNLSPDWEADELELSVLSPQDLDEEIYLEIFDYESDGNVSYHYNSAFSFLVSFFRHFNTISCLDFEHNQIFIEIENMLSRKKIEKTL